MEYEIVVARDGRHFFRTKAESISTQYQLNHMYETFKKKFTESEGY